MPNAGYRAFGDDSSNVLRTSSPITTEIPTEVPACVEVAFLEKLGSRAPDRTACCTPSRPWNVYCRGWDHPGGDRLAWFRVDFAVGSNRGLRPQ